MVLNELYGDIMKNPQHPSQPNIDTLREIADYFKVSIALLINEDLESYDLTIRERKKTVLPIKARAGYLQGLNDLEAEGLPEFDLPLEDKFQRNDIRYRIFPIEGDSMLPIQDGDYIITEEDTWKNVKEWFNLYHSFSFGRVSL